MKKYIIASTLDWYQEVPIPSIYDSPQFIRVATQEEFKALDLEELSPQFIFFIHWNWIVPKTVFSRFRCIVFHTAPLPYGRGGSPIQNLILNKYVDAPVNAIEMGEELDGGDIYGSETISLSGTIEEIFSRVALAVESLINTIINHCPSPHKQVGDPVYFKRLNQEDNILNEHDDLGKVFDKIRMVDGFNYPRAFIQLGGNKVEFTKAQVVGNTVVAQAVFKIK
jgi:methionyl-tRNA formyltransferase